MYLLLYYEILYMNRKRWIMCLFFVVCLEDLLSDDCIGIFIKYLYCCDYVVGVLDLLYRSIELNLYFDYFIDCNSYRECCCFYY